MHRYLRRYNPRGPQPRWTPEQVDLLKEAYPESRHPNKRAELERALGKPWHTIETKALRLGLDRATGAYGRWSRDEMQKVKEMWGIAPKEEILAALPGRTWKSIAAQAGGQSLTEAKVVKRWTSEELDLLRSSIAVARSSLPAREELVRKLDRAWPGIAAKAERLGLMVEDTPSIASWTGEELQFLKANYETMSIEELQARLPRRTLVAIKAQARDLGFKKRLIPLKPWTPQDVQYLIDNYGKKSNIEIARHLSRTTSAVTSMSSALIRQDRILLAKDYWSDEETEVLKTKYPLTYKDPAKQEELAQELGRTWKAITRKAVKMGFETVGYDRWTPRQMQILREKFPLTYANVRRQQDLIEELGKTWKAIIGKANSLGIYVIREGSASAEDQLWSPWTPKELQILRDNVVQAVGFKSVNIEAQRRLETLLPGRTWLGCYKKAVKLGYIEAESTTPWSPEEEIIVKEKFETEPKRAILSQLPGRTWHAIQAKAGLFGLGRRAMWSGPVKYPRIEEARPDLLLELDPDGNQDLLIAPGKYRVASAVRIDWLCPNGHRYTTPLLNRALRGTDCARCHIPKRSKFEIELGFELQQFLPVIIDSPIGSGIPAKIRTATRYVAADLLIPDLDLIIEFDGIGGHFLHKDPDEQNEVDVEQTLALAFAGYNVLRVRMEPVSPIYHPYYQFDQIMLSYKTTVKEAAVKVLKFIERKYGFKFPKLSEYEAQPLATNQVAAKLYIREHMEPWSDAI